MYKSNFFVTSQASFDDMHRRLPTEYKDRVDIVNFRSNIVVSGGEPYQEEAWKAIRIGGHTFEKVKLCKVCKATLVDRSSASLMPEPLSTLSGYRSTPEGVFFGCLMNWVPTGDVCVQLPLLVVSKGMPVSVL